LKSTEVCAKTLFPERFTLPFSSLHRQIFNILDDDTIQKAAIAAPRGFGKTSLVNIAYPAQQLLFRRHKFIVQISNKATQAMLQSENLKQELLYNNSIKDLFGPMKSDTFSKEMWVTQTGTMVLPRGAGQQVRGLLYGRNRPGLIILDDIEDSEAVQNPEQRAKMKEWFFADVMNSISRARSDWRIVVVGTLLHEDSLLANLLEDPNWITLQLSICNDKYESNWPDFISNEGVRKLADSYATQGLLDAFYREYRNIPVARENASFDQAMMKRYTEEKWNKEKQKDLESVVIVDPAKTVKMQSDFSAIVGLTFDSEKGRVYVRDVVAERLYPEEVYEHAFAMADRLGARAIGLEVTSLNEFITYPFNTAMRKRGKFYELVELKARGKKEDRIKALVPFYRMGIFWHNENVAPQIEAQLIAFPRAKRDDISDAIAYCVEMFSLGNRVFQADLTAEEMEAQARGEEYDEFAGLQYDPPLAYMSMV
jgi:hypothetical protein